MREDKKLKKNRKSRKEGSLYSLISYISSVSFLPYNCSVMDHCLCVCELLKAAASVSERKLNEALSTLDVSHCQAQILLKISEDAVSMSALSKVLCCHKSNVTQVVDGLVEKGLVVRSMSQKDRRACVLTLTTKGKKAMQGIDHALKNQATQCMKVFTPEEKQMLAGLLRKYIGERG